jgi:uncharacterized protein (TIGR02453 family)
MEASLTNTITHELFRFLRDLQDNNNKDWFDANKSRYQQHAQRPMLSFIETMSPWLATHTPAFLADSRTNGGSLFRIYRDTRFSADKSPFKTNIGCNFRHRIGKDAHAPGFYLHISPGEIFFGGGIWSPQTSVLNRIRDAIVAQPDRWRDIVADKAFVQQLGGLADADMLKTVPRGYAKDHDFAHDLKRKSIFAFASCTEAQVCAVDFPDRVMTAFGTLAPMMQFTTDALGLSWE